MTIFIICLSLISLFAAIWFMLRRQRFSPAAAWIALALLFLTSAKVPTLSTIGFWAAAAAIATVINFMLPKSVSESLTGQGYIAGGALAGMFVGMIMSQSAMIVGAIAGAFLGAFVFSRTPAGKAILQPFSKFANYVCAKGMSAIITACIIGITINYIILLTNPLQ